VHPPSVWKPEMILLPSVFLSILFFHSTILAGGTVLDLGNGISTLSDSSGRSGTIVDLGGCMKSYSDNRGVSGTILGLGAGMQTYPLPFFYRASHLSLCKEYRRNDRSAPRRSMVPDTPFPYPS
jgi:hypothetical protein